jgi:DNA-directed RNA polymerase subunit H (RpoH/RPB5)
METTGYNTNGYNIFSINEIDAMYHNNQLDMLLTHSIENKKVYIKYYFSSKTQVKQMRPQTLDAIIDDLYEIDNVLNKNDTLVIIIDEEPNATMITKVKYIYDTSNIFVVIHNIKRLQFNILEHTLVPKVEVLKEDEVEKLKKNINLKSLTQLPEISRFDPMSLAIMLKPGQIAKFTRSSQTALTSLYYRICV